MPVQLCRKAILAGLVSLMVVTLSSTAMSETYTFDGTVLDTEMWEITQPLGASTIVQDDAIYLTSDGTYGYFPSQPYHIGPGVGISTRWALVGDFDIRVDYGGFDEPVYTQAFFNIYQDPDNAIHIKRIHWATGNAIQVVWFVDGVGTGSGLLGWPTEAGSLGIARTGSTVDFYADGEWIWSAPDVFTGEVKPSMVLLADGGAGDMYFDNFTVNVGTWSPVAALDDLSELVEILGDTGEIAAQLERSVQAKIDSALAALTDGRPNGATAAANKLGALLNQIDAQRGKKISADAADAIAAMVSAVIAEL